MAGNKNQKKTSIFSFLKNRRARRVEAYKCDEIASAEKVWASDEDGRYWVAEPGIDRKASAYIDRIHKSCFMESECQTVTLCPSANAQ